MSELSVSDFLTAFKTRRKFCRALLKLSRQQRALIDEDDYTQLLIILGRKQRILGHLEDLKKEHPGLLKCWKTGRSGIDPEVRDDCEHILAETETILSELVHKEATSTEHMNRRRDATRKQLQSLNQGTEVNQSYRDNLAPATSRHLDVNR